MDKQEAIEYLKGRLKEIPALAKLRHNNPDYPLWILTIRGVVERVFGKDSYQYKILEVPYRIHGSSEMLKNKSYVENLRKRRTAILSIIQTWEALGSEAETNSSPEPQEAYAEETTWESIDKEFGVTKKGFGKRINFVKDPFKRKILFRDVEHAYYLASSGFSKPAVILAGGVLEELLRFYLKAKNIKPVKDTLNGYIQTCGQEDLFKSGVSHLSDSVRHFRNLVHLAKEETKRNTISKSTAKGAVASIFTIASDINS